jgi:hypothetical protein
MRRIAIIFFFFLGFLMQGCIRDEVLLPPVISSFDKNPVPSDNILVITGKYFDPSSTLVYINDTIVSNAGSVALSETRIFIPARKQTSKVTIYVKTKYGSSNKENITILPPAPSIRKIIPAKAGIGKKIKVVGSYIGSTTSVQFKSPDQPNSIPAQFTMLPSDTLEVTIPEGLSKDAADIRVGTKSGISEPAAFTVLYPPIISSFNPEQGVAGSTITLHGKEFATVNSVFIGIVAAELLSVSNDQIQFRIPSGAQSDTVYVDGLGGAAKTEKKIQITPPPTISSLDKVSGSIGEEITINGTNLIGAFEVKFGSAPSQITSNTGLVLKTKVPSGASSGKISITTPAGTGASPQEFVVTGTPFISSFSPTSGGIGTKILLSGINLLTVTSAKIGLVNLKINSKSDTQMEVEVLTNSVTGKISVVAGVTFETATNFTVSGSPQITSFTPTSGAPGTLITITGLNFSNNPDVKFGTSTSATVTQATATQIICQVPSSASTGKINVNGALSNTDFTLSVKSVITSITPLKGGVDKEITIVGQYLTGATIKFFNNITAVKVGTGTDAQVVVKVPVGTTTGKISITTPGGTTLSTNDFQFLVAPTIASFTPTAGIIGTTVTISGTNLQHNPEVRFFNNVLGVIKSFTATQIVVDVPVGTTTGKISVKTDAINAAVLSASDFVIVGKPTVASISPASGTINERVTISGTNLANPVSVSFDGVSTSTFISASATSIIVRVPASVNGISNRTINVNVKTAADNSNNQAFSLLGTPTITKISPNNNPASWAFLIEGTNLNSVKKITLDNRIPTIPSKTNGIDNQAFNYLTTKVPNDLKPPTNQNKSLVLYYTSDDFGALPPVNYQVLSVPPPGVFPPPFIILPPPLPVNFIQNDISAYWEDEFLVSQDSAHCFNIRGNFRDASDFANQTGTFCQFEEYFSINGNYSDVRTWTGGWNKGILELTSGSLTLKGQVSGSNLIFTDNNGRQLKLRFDSTGGCAIINSNGCENDD